MDVMEFVKRQNPPSFRVGPVTFDDKCSTVYIVRGEKGSVTYHDRGDNLCSEIGVHSLIHEGKEHSCPWNGGAMTNCGIRASNRIQDVERIWLTLESEYWCL